MSRIPSIFSNFFPIILNPTLIVIYINYNSLLAGISNFTLQSIFLTEATVP